MSSIQEREKKDKRGRVETNLKRRMHIPVLERSRVGNVLACLEFVDERDGLAVLVICVFTAEDVFVEAAIGRVGGRAEGWESQGEC